MVSRYSGILVSWYPGILVSRYPGILVSWYPSILISWYPSILVFLELRKVQETLLYRVSVCWVPRYRREGIRLMDALRRNHQFSELQHKQGELYYPLRFRGWN